MGNLQFMKSFNIDVPELDTVATRVYLSINDEFVGFITLTDKIKESAAYTIQTLKNTGKNIILESGDNPQVVEHVA